MEVNYREIFYIKLGEKGAWEHYCLRENPSLRIDFKGVKHEDCVNAEWEKVHAYYLEIENKVQAKATDHVRELKTFYQTDEDQVWISFYANKMWWCIPNDTFEVLPDQTTLRHLERNWSDEDLHGRKLTLGDLSGKLTKTQAYRQTICSVEAGDYALRKINGLDTPEVLDAKEAKQTLIGKVEKLIQWLTWQDFEVLVDLVFRQAGWQRLSQIGKTAKSIDLELLQPVTGEKCMVQIKSRSNQQEFSKYCQDFREMSDYGKFFYVVHTEMDRIAATVEGNVQLIKSDQLAELVINAGLVDWVIRRN